MRAVRHTGLDTDDDGKVDVWIDDNGNISVDLVSIKPYAFCLRSVGVCVWKHGSNVALLCGRMTTGSRTRLTTIRMAERTVKLIEMHFG
jgi:hypothetical protein